MICTGLFNIRTKTLSCFQFNCTNVDTHHFHYDEIESNASVNPNAEYNVGLISLVQISLQNCNGWAIDIWESISTFIPYLMMDVIIYAWWDNR